MIIDEVNDDLGLAKPPYRVVACLAVHGRLPLLEQTIKRLYRKNGCYKVICSGDGVEEKKLCESLGAVWIHHPNRHLGGKWNLSFKAAKEYSPDAVVFVGSSDWLSDNWFSVMRPYVEQYGFAGVPGCHLADLGEKIRLCDWKGYKEYRHERADESIGIGRMLSRRLLDAMGWQPFKPILNNSLDRSMKDNAKKCGFKDFMVHDDRLKALSVSAPNHWTNKHQFEMHWDGRIPSERLQAEPFLTNHFPEIHEVFKILYPATNEKDNRVGRRTSYESSSAQESNRM